MKKTVMKTMTRKMKKMMKKMMIRVNKSEKNKKQKVKINNINFVGNVIFSDAKLKSKLKKTGEKPRVGLFKSIFYNSIELLKPKNYLEIRKG